MRLFAQWTFVSLLDVTGRLMGERVYRLSDGSYLVEVWVEGAISSWFVRTPPQMEKVLEEREFPYRGPMNEPRQPKWALG